MHLTCQGIPGTRASHSDPAQTSASLSVFVSLVTKHTGSGCTAQSTELDSSSSTTHSWRDLSWEVSPSELQALTL